jgi:hypothetical protein
MEDDLKKINRRQPQKNGRRPKVKFKKSTLIGCDILVKILRSWVNVRFGWVKV